MNTRIQTNTWIYRTVIVLGSIVLTSAVGSILLTMMAQPLVEIPVALGSVAAAGLLRLLISPLMLD